MFAPVDIPRWLQVVEYAYGTIIVIGLVVVAIGIYEARR